MRLTPRAVEIFLKGERIAAHLRASGNHRHTTVSEHVMGASNFTYAEASWSQALADWIGAHTRAFAALGGVPKLLVPDNTKVAVIKACLYEPQVNRTLCRL